MNMLKLTLLLIAASVGFAAGWDSVQRVAPGHKVEVSTNAETMKGTFVSASETAVIVRTTAGEQSIARTDVRKVRISDPGRRTRNGLLGTAIGAGVGFGLGYAVCPHCANEGAGGKFTGPFTAVGAGLGATAGFLPPPFSTIYKSN
jgi:hypothetical protein